VSEEAEDTEEPREISEWRDSLMLEEGIGRVLLDRLAAFDAATPEASEEDVMGVIVVRRWFEQDLSAEDREMLATTRGQTFDTLSAEDDSTDGSEANWEAIDKWYRLEVLSAAMARVVLARLAAFDAATPEASEEDVMGVIVVRRWLEQDLLPYEMDALRLRSNRPDSAI
jgi:hypothetical protein